jgi:hypothetical protein
MSLEADQKVSANTLPENSPLMRIGYAFCGFVVLFSVFRMIWVILEGSRLQYADYWLMIESLLRPDGSLSLPGLFNFSNHHFVAFPQLLYFLNIKLFAGSNIALGLIDVAIVCCLVGVLILMIRRSNLDRPLQLATMGLMGALLFGLSGAWNFTHGMSGAAWLSANLFVVTAIYQRSLDRNRTAFAAAVLATISYGTGIFAWPAILAVGIVRRPFAQWWREWPYVLGLVISAAIVKILSNNSGDTSTNDYLVIGQLAATFLGTSVGLSGGLAEAAGWVVLVGTPLCAIWLALFVRPQEDAGWIGLVAYGWSTILVITQGRAMFMAAFGYQGRYYSLAALTWLGFSVMLILTLKSLGGLISGRLDHDLNDSRALFHGQSGFIQTIVPYILILPLTVGVLISGDSEVEKRDLRIYDQELKEIALQLDVVDGSVAYLEGFSNNTKQFDSTQRLKIVGHYPFVEDWNLDCGFLGKKLQEFSTRRMGGEIRNVVSEKGLNFVSRIGGILPGEDIVKGSIHCILVTDTNSLVVGVGTPRPKDNGKSKQHFSALAHEIEGDHKVYIFDDGRWPILLSGLDVTRGGAK